MKKLLVSMCLMLLVLMPVAAIGMPGLYDIIVPMNYDNLTISGDMASNGVVMISIPTTGSASLDVGLEGDYFFLDQSADSLLSYGLNASFGIGAVTDISLATGSTPRYRLYGIDVSSMDGFLAAGGNGGITFSSATGLSVNLSPYIGAGIGRIYNISNVIYAELMMKYLGLPISEERVRAVAEIFNTSNEFFNAYTADDSKLAVEYWRSIGQAMGLPEERMLELIYLGNSQVYAFERARYAGLMYGNEVLLRLDVNPSLNTSWVTPFSIGGNLGMYGEIGGFSLDDILYYHAAGNVRVGYSGSFFLALALNGTASYFPEDYHWWATAGLNTTLNISTSTTFSVSATAEVDYLIDPNFTLNGNVMLSTTSGIEFTAGGTYRVW